jgi:hypothetical protein
MTANGDDVTERSLSRLSTPSLMALGQNLEAELQKSPIYRDFVVVRKLLAARQHTGGVRVSYDRPTDPETPYRPVTVRLGRVTAIGAALMALEHAGRPMNIHELVDAVKARGFEFGGSSKSPPSALSAYFAKPGPKSPIVSIWIDNKPMWWFRDRPVPGAEVA